MLDAVLSITALALAFGLILGFAAQFFHVEGDPLVEKIEALLPQSQCGQCGYAGCHPYAEAVAHGEADINLCVPGGEQTISGIADLMGVDPKPLDTEAAAGSTHTGVVAIDEHNCIGCTLCIQACPVDAIIGAAKQMHTVIESECTGCGLCVPVCPVECIHPVDVRPTIETWQWPSPYEPLLEKAR
jgi:electron transport complex protein RnfB